jgi:hypothetical protein
MSRELKIRCDTSRSVRALAALSNAAELFPEIRQALVSLLDSGEQLIRIDGDGLSATGADELLVSFHPSDALLGLLSAAGAGDVDFSVFEHATSPFDLSDESTTDKDVQ